MTQIRKNLQDQRLVSGRHHEKKLGKGGGWVEALVDVEV